MTDESGREFSAEDAAWKAWARMIFPELICKVPNTNTENEDDYVFSVRDQIGNWYESSLEEKFEYLYDNYMNNVLNARPIIEFELAYYIGLIEGEYFNNGYDEILKGRCCDWIDKIENFLLKHPWVSVMKNQAQRDCLVLKGTDPDHIKNIGIFSRESFDDAQFRIKVAFSYIIKDLALNPK
jgi:hypothetical protein